MDRLTRMSQRKKIKIKRFYGIKLKWLAIIKNKWESQDSTSRLFESCKFIPNYCISYVI